VVKTEKGESLARQFECSYLKTSAKDGFHVNEMFNTMATAMKRRAENMLDYEQYTEEVKIFPVTNISNGKGS
jgi:hypothetical protein